MKDEYQEFVNLIDRGSPYREAFVVSGCNVKTQGTYYVYALVDPRYGRAFYIGKGKGSRMKDHAKAAKRGKIDNAEKHKAIASILESGCKVEEHVFCRCTTEAEAFSVERFLIRSLKHCGLTNISLGCKSNAELCLEKAKALKSMCAPLSWLLENPDKDFIKVFGSMQGFYEWFHATVDRVIKHEQDKIDGKYGNYYS